MKIYIIGRVSGMGLKAKVLFDEAENHLLKIKSVEHVVNPMNLPNVHINNKKLYSKKCLIELLKCDAVYLLKNWQQSNLAKLEMKIVRQLKITILN